MQLSTGIVHQKPNRKDHTQKTHRQIKSKQDMSSQVNLSMPKIQHDEITQHDEHCEAIDLANTRFAHFTYTLRMSLPLLSHTRAASATSTAEMVQSASSTPQYVLPRTVGMVLLGHALEEQFSSALLDCSQCVWWWSWVW